MRTLTLSECRNASKEHGGKCLGYTGYRGNIEDDEPIEQCKACPNYTGYEEE